MNTHSFLKVVLLCLAVLGIDANYAWAVDPVVQRLSKVAVDEIPEIPFDALTLAGGAKLYYAKSDELPIVHLSLYFDIGTIHESRDERGITDLFMSALRSGGTRKYPSKKVDEMLERMAASISVDAENELVSIAVTCLEKNLDEVLSLVFSMVREPAFEKERVEIIRKNALYGMKRRNEEPMPIAKREFEQSLYGKDSPHAWMPTEETLGKITDDSLKNFHKKNFTVNRLRLAATSPLDLNVFRTKIESQLAGWQGESDSPKYPTQIEKKWQPAIEFINKPGNQTSIVLGHFGDKRFNPDKFAVLLINEVLGGATFGARLGDRIRTELGLAYSVGSGFEFGTDYGVFKVVVQTKSESTLTTLNEIKKIVKELVDDRPVTQAELDYAKDKTLIGLVFEYESPFNIVNMNLRYDFFGYPKNYLGIFQKSVSKVTLAEAQAAAKKYIFPDKLKIMIVGDKTKIKGLDTLPNMTEVPLDNE